MRRTYGLILDSTATGVTRVMAHDEEVTIQRLTIHAEVTLKQADFQELADLLQAGKHSEEEKQSEKLAEYDYISRPGWTILSGKEGE